jgi:hypothetical protein
MSNIEFDGIEVKEMIRTYDDLLKEKQNVEYETATSKEQVINIQLFFNSVQLYIIN